MGSVVSVVLFVETVSAKVCVFAYKTFVPDTLDIGLIIGTIGAIAIDTRMNGRILWIMLRLGRQFNDGI
jgi:hypothetical protein